jgi:hypothetical protein
MSNHVLLTRCRFDDDKLFHNYFEIMKKIYIPSLNSQKNKDFTLFITIYPQHFDLVRKEISDDIKIIPVQNFSNDYRNYIKENNVILQTRHDCDDYMSPDYISQIKTLYETNKKKYDDFILNFHPTKIEYKTGKEFTHSGKYERVCSMFSTLVQKENRKSIMDYQHTKLNEVTKNIIYIQPKDYVKLTIHNYNKLSKFLENDKPLNKNFYKNVKI